MKNAIRAVLCMLCTVVSAVLTYNVLSLTSYAANLGDYSNLVGESAGASCGEIINEMTEGLIIETVNCEVLVSSINRQIQVYTVENSKPIVGSVELRVGGGYISTEPVVVDTDSLMQVYTDEYTEQSWDTKGKINIIHTLWNFLVEQNDVDEVVASAIIGSIMYEGRFCEEQGTYRKLLNIEQAREVLGEGKCGYGVAQWTYKTRQRGLLKYYELTNGLFPDDWETACVVAECCMLLREIEAYGVFDSLYEETTIEDAVGRMCLNYEVYEGVHEQWSSEGGYHLISHKGSGAGRLAYSENIYNYFTGE